MPLTKVRYDMLDAEVTTRITEQVSLTGAGSPFVFEATNDGNTETLTKFKVDSVEKNIRFTEITGNKLVLTLASFTPTITVAGQSLAWDQSATTFSVGADNPTVDFPDQWISDVASIAAVSGSITDDLTKFDLSGASLPLGTSGDFSALYTVKSGQGYIRPTHNSVTGTATGGSASAAVTVKSDTTTGSPENWPTTYTWETNWQNVSHNISLGGLSGKTFLKQYSSANYTVSTSGLSNSANVSHTVTGTNGTPSNASGSGTLNFATAIHKDNTSTATKVTLASTFTRPQAVTGTSYTYSPANDDSDNVASGASFSYPSITLFTAAGTEPALGDVIADGQASGFDPDVTLLADKTKNFPQQAVVNNTGATRVFWFGVKTSGVTQPTVFLTGSGALMSSATPLSASLNLKPSDVSGFAGTYNVVGYTFYGFNVAAESTLYISIS